MSTYETEKKDRLIKIDQRREHLRNLQRLEVMLTANSRWQAQVIINKQLWFLDRLESEDTFILTSYEGGLTFPNEEDAQHAVRVANGAASNEILTLLEESNKAYDKQRSEANCVKNPTSPTEITIPLTSLQHMLDLVREALECEVQYNPDLMITTRRAMSVKDGRLKRLDRILTAHVEG